VVERLGEDLKLVTTRVACDYYARVEAFEEIVVSMSLADLGERRVTMVFEYLRETGEGREPVARGEQEVACMRESEGELAPTAVPAELRAALRAYR
jgi:enediyne biosynthesis thioesterase